MTKLEDINARVRQQLDDPDARRFSDDLLLAALRQSLEQVTLALPRSCTFSWTVAAAGRDQVLTGLSGCLFITRITLNPNGTTGQELQPESGFTYSLRDGIPGLHFHGTCIPQAGDSLSVEYAAGYLIEGLDGSTSTTLPAACEAAVVSGTAAYACYLRAGSLLESYGVRDGESARLAAIGDLWQKVFERSLRGLKVMQEFGFPPGFPLDQWDERRP